MNQIQESGWAKFWEEHWPRTRRKQKKNAREQWSRIKPALYEKIFSALERQKKQPAWNKDGGAFIPYPHRWLRDQRWEDEVTLPENRDVDILIAELYKHASMPADFPARIAERFRRMCEKNKTNWPRLNYILNERPGIESDIRDMFLSS